MQHLQACFLLQGGRANSVVKLLKLKHSPVSKAEDTVHHIW